MKSSKPQSHHLIWVDMEMTGLNPQSDRILEVAMVITNASLEVLARAPVLVLHQEAATLSAMDKWNQSTHAKNGLIEKVLASGIDEAAAEQTFLDFLKEWVPTKTSPMCGNSICQDRRFMANYLPRLEAYFHYRNLDVSTLKELCQRWLPEVAKGFKKQQKHSALADIEESIEELRYYRKHFIRV